MLPLSWDYCKWEKRKKQTLDEFQQRSWLSCCLSTHAVPKMFRSATASYWWNRYNILRIFVCEVFIFVSVYGNITYIQVYGMIFHVKLCNGHSRCFVFCFFFKFKAEVTSGSKCESWVWGHLSVKKKLVWVSPKISLAWGVSQVTAVTRFLHCGGIFDSASVWEIPLRWAWPLRWLGFHPQRGMIQDDAVHPNFQLVLNSQSKLWLFFFFTLILRSPLRWSPLRWYVSPGIS